MASERTYRFEPLERRGLLLGLGAGQLAVLGMALVAGVAMVTHWPGVKGLAAGAGALAVAGALCRPVVGRPPAHWAGLALSFAGRRREQVSQPPGHDRLVPGLCLPAAVFVPGVRLHQLGATADGPALGVLVDERMGTVAAVLRARGGPFCLADGIEKDALVAGWASVLESLAAGRSNLARFQWCQRAVPADSEALLAHLRRAGDPSSPGLAGQAARVSGAGARSWRHETLLVVSMRRRPGRGAPVPEDALALRNELRSLRTQLRAAGILCEGALDGQGVARALGGYLVPAPGGAGHSYPWPLAFDEHWSEVRGDGLWHRTYWVAEWPRSRVGPDFLTPLLMGTGRRSFSVTMAPVPPEQAMRDAEASRTAQIADSHLRAQGGFLETAKHRRQAEAVEGREAELADGRAAFRLSGYVSVSAAERAGLDAASAELERSAASAQLCLRPLYGQQREALSWALPMGRGL